MGLLLIGVVDSYSMKFCVVIGVTSVTMIAYISIDKEITNVLGSIHKALLGRNRKQVVLHHMKQMLCLLRLDLLQVDIY